MLLTSSQVSVAISSVIVFLFTTALFLAGYVLQQQTVRDLRAAIKPQIARGLPELQVFLQPQFSEDEELTKLGATDPSPQSVMVDGDRNANVNTNGEQREFRGENEKVEEEMEGGIRRQKVKQLKEQLAFRTGNKEGEMESQNAEVEEEDIELPHAEDDRNTKEEPEEKPLSRAARRKKIKEQILADGDGEHFKGYRRRAW
ncbi:uncharacterized protein BP5553_01561 [Venustampulla echinocandica]|uniref:Uncharacterized protein n=1 Tax=Venustampulla echinocandica TaxID=2656787 RepID=A0A370U1D0_9HELO|nr:uncharacterized protein BP5553_01561 [Venustampulla echinocandica]RDL41582.1 hypothetical protein BP5553_01561 [Venustampulla echinocandica]